MRFVRMLVMGVAVLGFMTLSAQAGTIDLIVNAYAEYNGSVYPISTKCADIGVNPLSEVPLGAIVTYEIAVAVDDSGGSTAPGNLGLATIVFDVQNCGACSGYQMPYITAAESGYAELPDGSPGALRDVTKAMYTDSGTTAYAGYNAGWGFDNSNLPIGGNVTSVLCKVAGAGSLAPLTWTADVNPSSPGLQPYARMGVGLGPYTFPADDPAAGGLQGGFGQDLSNARNVIPGDGHWLMFRGTLDTSGWDVQSNYGWELVPTNGAVYSPTVDYNVDQGQGFRIAVFVQNMGRDSFAFFLGPEPASLGLLVLGCLALVRRRQ